MPKPNLSPSRKSELRIFYRSLQVHHGMATEASKAFLPVVIPTAEVILITSIFTVIRFHDRFNQLLLLALIFVALFAGIMLGLAIENAVRVTTKSAKMGELGSSSGRRFEKEDVAFFKSCLPLKWKIGGSFSLNRDTFIRIMNDVVVVGVMNLLIAYF